MSKLILPPEVQKEVDKEGSNVVPMVQPETGGSPPAVDCWVKKLGEGTVFTARPTGKQPINLVEYHVIAQHVRGTTLFVRDPTGGGSDMYINIDPIVFSIQLELYEIIKDGDPI